MSKLENSEASIKCGQKNRPYITINKKKLIV